MKEGKKPLNNGYTLVSKRIVDSNGQGKRLNEEEKGIGRRYGRLNGVLRISLYVWPQLNSIFNADE